MRRLLIPTEATQGENLKCCRPINTETGLGAQDPIAFKTKRR